MEIHEYLTRMNYHGSLEPTLQTLQALQEAHLLAVPFENFSMHQGWPIILQEEALYKKIVERYLGGTCWELNGLFAWLLHQLGFQVTVLSAETVSEVGGFSPEFDHMALMIHQLSGADWLVDVGSGGRFLRPFRIETDVEQKDVGRPTYRLHKEEVENDRKTKRDYWILQRLDGSEWKTLYRFTLQPYALTDFEAMCYYQQTSPESFFVKNRECSLATATGYIALINGRFIMAIQDERKEQEVTRQEEYSTVLAEQFGIIL